MELITSNKRSYTSEQTAVIEANIKQSMILKATAGSGKTAVATERVKYLIAKGVDPSRIIFFSYTVAAVKEFKKRLNNDNVKVTTIHAFCMGMLAQMGKGKKVVDIYDFLEWYKKTCKPKPGSSQLVKDEWYHRTNKMYEDANYIGSEITAYKLQLADNIKCRLPKYIHEYWKFQKETKSRDFSDMLIEVKNLLKDNKWLRLFKNKYDYILCDEAQDQSTIMMYILLTLNAKYYTLILDKNQSIFAYSGANVDAIISMLKKRRECVEMTLSRNFRSSSNIVEYSNKYSDLTAVADSNEVGEVNENIILLEDLVKILRENKDEEITLLSRTNSVIKNIEFELLLRKIPFRYTNYITEEERSDLKKSVERPSTTKKIKPLLPVFKTVDNILLFIEQNMSNKAGICTIHKSKGLEWDTCIVVNCLSPELLKHNNIVLDEKHFKQISFDPNDPEDFESRNIFYVAVSRPKKCLRFMLHDV